MHPSSRPLTSSLGAKAREKEMDCKQVHRKGSTDSLALIIDM